MQHVEPGEDVKVVNVTDEYGVLVVTGPRSRDVLAKPHGRGPKNEDGFTWMQAREISVAGITVRALGFLTLASWAGNCIVPSVNSRSFMMPLWRVVKAFGIRRFGTYAMNSLRMEKAYKGWGSELTTEISLVESDMTRFAKKSGGYIGSDVVEKKMRDGVPIHLRCRWMGMSP